MPRPQPAHAEGDRLHLDKHAHPPGLPRVEQKVHGTDGTDIVDNAHCVSGRRSTPCFAVERGCGRGIESLPLLVREAAHHGRCVFAVGEEACSDGLTVYPVAEAVVPPREPCLRFVALQSIASLALRHPFFCLCVASIP
jgi:hypothetical protein